MIRFLFLALALVLIPSCAAYAQIVALGASNTRGYELPISDAWPSQLESLLRSRGHDVSVTNQGINGDTSIGMLQRFDTAVPQGTRVVILECCGNDNKNSSPRYAVADHNGNIRALVEKAKSKGIAVVFLSNTYEGETDTAGINMAKSVGAQFCGGATQGVPPEHKLPSRDGIHADAIGQQMVAKRILPCVLHALGAA